MQGYGKKNGSLRVHVSVGTAPTWNENLELEVGTKDDIMFVTIMDFDRLKKDDFVGECTIPLKQLLLEPDRPMWYTILDKEGEPHGEIQLTASIEVNRGSLFCLSNLRAVRVKTHIYLCLFLMLPPFHVCISVLALFFCSLLPKPKLEKLPKSPVPKLRKEAVR